MDIAGAGYHHRLSLVANSMTEDLTNMDQKQIVDKKFDLILKENVSCHD